MAEKQKTKRHTADKRLIQNAKKAHFNKVVKSKVKVAFRDLHEAINQERTEENKIKIELALSRCYSALDKACKKKVFAKSRANRYKSKASILVK